MENIDCFKEIIKIDHHPYEDKMGNVEWVDTTSSSTCQLIIELIFSTKLKFTKQVAGNLFLGVVSDSDRFLLSYTTSTTFELITRLIEENDLDFINLYPKLYERPIEEIRFHGYLSENMQITENGLGYLKITPEIIKEYKVDLATPSNMINDFNFIKGVIAWVFITYDEKNNIYKANIRSRGPVINEVAACFNGGGHKFASGVRSDSKEDMDKLIQALDDACKKYQLDNQ